MSPSPKHNGIALRSAKPLDEQPNLSFQNLNFHLESDRLKSFENWRVSCIDPAQLATAGFYYLNRNNDTVRCAFCGVEVGCWVRGDDPMRDHQMWSPNCRFVRKVPCGNVPLNAPNRAPTINEAGYDTCGNYGIELRNPAKGADSSSAPNDVPSLEKLSVFRNKRPDFPNYATYEARMKSYRHWPISLKLKPSVLTEAGLFYLGRGDHVMCFHCGLGLKDWEDGDDPWVEHARWSSRCNYVLLIKGKEFIDEVCSIAEQEQTAQVNTSEEKKNEEVSERDIISPDSLKIIPKPQSPESSSKSEVSKSDGELIEAKPSTSDPKRGEDRLCKICYTEEMGVAFLPCGHIVACVKCAPSLTTCAVCRTPFLASARVYLS